MLERNAHGTLTSGEVLEPRKGAEHCQIPSFAGILSSLYFLLRTVGPQDLLFLSPICQGSSLQIKHPQLRPGTSPDAPYVGSLSHLHVLD